MTKALTEDDLTRQDAERDAYRHINLHRVPVLLQAETSVCAVIATGCTGRCNQGRACTCRPGAEMGMPAPDPEPRNPAKRSRWKRFVRELARWLRRSRLRM